MLQRFPYARFLGPRDHGLMMEPIPIAHWAVNKYIKSIRTALLHGASYYRKYYLPFHFHSVLKTYIHYGTASRFMSKYIVTFSCF